MSTEPSLDSVPMESGIPSLSSLGSLAQSARMKQLKIARGIMLGVGIITIIFNAIMFANTSNEVEGEIQKQLKVLHSQGIQEASKSVEEFRARVTRICQLIYGSLIVLGVVFVILGTLVRAFPVPATVLGLVLYVGATAILGFLNPMTLVGGWLWKILIVVGLMKSIQAAVAYQKG